MILTVRELVDHLGMNPKTDIVGASTLVRVLERLGAIKKVGSRPVLDENGKQTIGRPSALYEFPETVTFAFPTEPLAFVPKVKKEKKVKTVVVESASDVVETDFESVVEPVAVVDEPVAVVDEPVVDDEPVAVEREVVVEAEVDEPEAVSRVEDDEYDFSADSLLDQFLRESA
jgi:hypothetical protein